MQGAIREKTQNLQLGFQQIAKRAPDPLGALRVRFIPPSLAAALGSVFAVEQEQAVDQQVVVV